MQINEEKNEIKIIQAFDDWYLAEKKDYVFFANKYPMNGELTKQGNKIEAMEKWCKEVDINFTPTIFINNNQLPNAYSIEDLQYFLLNSSPKGNAQWNYPGLQNGKLGSQSQPRLASLLTLKATGTKNFLLTLKFKQNENNKNEPCKHSRQTQQN